MSRQKCTRNIDESVSQRAGVIDRRGLQTERLQCLSEYDAHRTMVADTVGITRRPHVARQALGVHDGAHGLQTALHGRGALADVDGRTAGGLCARVADAHGRGGGGARVRVGAA